MIPFFRPLLPLACAVLSICSGWAETAVSVSPVVSNLTGGDMGVPAALQEGTSFPSDGLVMVVAASSPKVQKHVLNGLACLLTFWDDAAYHEFRKAAVLDPSCMMAQWGLALSCISPHHEYEADKEKALQNVRNQLELGQLPSRELEYGRALVALIKNGPRDAAGVFQDIADSWKRDPWAPLFAIMMLRDGFDTSGQPKPGQEQARILLDTYLESHPKTPAAWFLKALLQETNPSPGEDALEAVRKALELAPGYAPSLHLLGHLQFRLGHYREAEESFALAAEAYANWRKAEQLVPPDDEGSFRSLAYKAMARFCRGDEDVAIREASQLATLPVDMSRPRASGTLMQLWETRTLPMRLAFSRYPWRGHREIEAVTPKPLAFSPPPLCEGVIAACIQASLGKTSLVRGDKKDLAARLENLGKICTSLAKSGPQADVEGAVSHWVRGLELCDRISLECKALYYPDSASVWLESDKEQQRFASLLMPPVLPYPAELRIAQWHARKKDWPACLSICDAGLRRFPNHAALLVLRQQAAHPDRKASASKKDVSRPKSKKKHSGSKTPKSGKSTQRLSNHSPK